MDQAGVKSYKDIPDLRFAAQIGDRRYEDDEEAIIDKGGAQRLTRPSTKPLFGSAAGLCADAV